MNAFALLLASLATTGMLTAVPHPRAVTTAAARAGVVNPIDPLDSATRGAWPLPDPHPIRHRFAPPDTRWGAGHRGVDLGGHVGSPVRSSLAGTITFASVLAGRGVVVVDHGGFRTTYEPVTAMVSVGDRVARGGAIGHLSLAQSHCFPKACLHWGLLKADTYLDPLMLVGGGPIRLLPMLR